MSWLPYLIMVFGTMIGALGAFFLKKGAENFSFSPWKMLKNKPFMLGGIIYVISIPIYLVALKMLPVSVAYPLTSITYIWSALLAKRFLGENVNMLRWTGILAIIIGVTLVSL